MKVYESMIEISMNPVFHNASKRNDEAREQLEPVYDRYFTPTHHAPAGITTQERALIHLFWERASHENKFAREIGYLGCYHNCVFNLLFGVFGVDIIGFLFDQAWVPEGTIDPFRPELFLDRLSVFERATAKLKDGTKTPVPLPKTLPYLRPGMGSELDQFSEDHHRLLLEYSLRELRDFGELGLSLQQRDEKQTVHVNIYWPYEEYDSEILAFASGPKKPRAQ